RAAPPPPGNNPAPATPGARSSPDTHQAPSYAHARVGLASAASDSPRARTTRQLRSAARRFFLSTPSVLAQGLVAAVAGLATVLRRAFPGSGPVAALAPSSVMRKHASPPAAANADRPGRRAGTPCLS